jgi:glycosyltransferase involved in cell wall biosynthesis
MVELSISRLIFLLSLVRRLYIKSKKFKMEKFISVIIPTYNRKYRLKNAIESVLAQTYPHFELIVVDDGSEDNTAEMVTGFDAGIVYIKQANRGPAAARNRGILAAQHNLIAFLDSDDRFAPDKLQVQAAAMQASSFLVSHTQEIWYRRGRILNQKTRHRKNSGNIFRQSLDLCAVGMSTVMLHRRIFDKFGLFDEEFPCCEDYDLWLRVSADQEFLLIDKPLTLKEGGRADQLSSIFRIGMDKYRIKAIVKILESGRLTKAQRRLAIQELENKCLIYGTGCIKHQRAAEGEYYLGLPRLFSDMKA